jgi:hypothetical protein
VANPAPEALDDEAAAGADAFAAARDAAVEEPSLIGDTTPMLQFAERDA